MIAAFTTDIPKLTNWGEPLLIGPGSIHVAHTDGEYIEKQQLAESIDLYFQDREATSQLISSLRAPRHLHAHWDFVLHGHGQQRGRVDFEIGERGRNGSGDASLVALRDQFKCDLLIVRGLAGELDLDIGFDVSDDEADSGRRVRTVTMGNSAPRVTWIMCRSRLLSPESNVLTGTAIRKSHCPSWQMPLPRAAWLTPFALMQRVRDVIGQRALLEQSTGGRPRRGWTRLATEIARKYSSWIRPLAPRSA
jgi:hypothetical protein